MERRKQEALRKDPRSVPSAQPHGVRGRVHAQRNVHRRHGTVSGEVDERNQNLSGRFRGVHSDVDLTGIGFQLPEGNLPGAR